MFGSAKYLSPKGYGKDIVYFLCNAIGSVDVDGDKSLVVADKTIIKVAERNMKGIVPLYYNMKKAEPVHLNNVAIYNGLNAAFTGSNIGQYSNNISKIWNSEVFISGTDEEKEQAIDVIKILCMENNFCIDAAKTLYMPERPEFVRELVTSFTKENVPYFFRYAKDKEEHQVSKLNNSFVNKLNTIIPNPRINCRGLGLGKIDYTLLMHNSDIECRVQFTDRGKLIKEKTDPLIIKYCELNKKYGYAINNAKKIDNSISYEILKNSKLRQDLRYRKIYLDVKNELSMFGYSDMEISDILVKFLYGIKESKHKMVLWLCYGDYIYKNLSEKIKIQTRTIKCVDCGEWISVPVKDNKSCRCSECNEEYKREQTRLRVQRHRKSNVTVSN